MKLNPMRINKFLLFKLFLTILIFTLVKTSQGQGTTCNNAAPFCTSTVSTFPAGVNQPDATITAPGNNYDCLFTAPNPAWYYLEIDQSGNLVIDISNNANVFGVPADIDFAIWGPFNDIASAISNCGSLPLPVDCSYSPTAYPEQVNINGAVSGQVYIMLVTNYDNVACDITLTNSGNSTTDCNIVNPCSISSITTTLSSCLGTTGNFNINGTILFNNAPSTGQLIVQNCSGDQAVYNPPFSSPLTYNINGIIGDGTTNCSVTATFTDDPTCTLSSSTFTEPSCSFPCNIQSVNNSLSSCDPVALTFNCIGTVDFINPPITGQLIVRNCSGDSSVYTPPFLSPFNYNINGIPGDGTQNCRVVAYFTDSLNCTDSSLLFMEPVCTAPCSITNLTLALDSCTNNNGLYYSGSVTFLNAPSTGQLTITDCHGIQQVFNAPFVSPINYVLNNVPADGQPCNVIANFTSNPSCADTVSFSPSSTPFIHATMDTLICAGNAVDLVADSMSGGMLVDQFTMVFDQAFSYTTTATNLPGAYYIETSGTYTAVGMPHIRDGAFNYGAFNPPLQHSEWKWNGMNPNTQSTVPTLYNPNHIYNFYFQGGAPQTFSFSELQASWYNDNYGSLEFKVYYLGNLTWSNGVTTQINSVSPNSNTTYIANIDYLNGCTASDTVTVQVSDMQFTQSTQDVTCIGLNDGSIAFDFFGGLPPYQYNWAHTLTNVDSLGSLYAGDYTLIVSDNIGCTDTIVTTLSGPQAITIHQTDLTHELCFGDCSGQMMVHASDAYFFSMDSVNFQIDSNFTGLCSGNYFVYLRDSVGCQNHIGFTINSPQDITLSITNDTTICTDGTASIVANAAGGSGNLSYYWNDVQNSNLLNLVLQNDSILCVNVVDSSGCRSDTLCSSINVLPLLNINPVSAIEICIGDSVEIIANVGGGNGGPYNYIWTNNSSIDSSIIISPTISGVYSVTATDNCETPAAVMDVNVVVNSYPNVQFTADVLASCKPLNTTFNSVVSPAGSTYEWDFGDGSFSTIDSSVNHVYVDTGCFDVQLTITSPEGCSTTVDRQQYICSYEIPSPEFYWEPDSATLLNTFFEFYNNSISASTYNWEIDVNGTIVSFNSEEIDYTFPNFQAGEYPVCLTATSDYGCDSTVCGLVKVNNQFFIYMPTGFTPADKDMVNDEFKPVIYGAEVGSYQMQIFNRSGELLFESNDLSYGWNGDFDGVLCPMGVYVWKIKVDDEFSTNSYSYFGNVTLVR